jgi:hypothetical protein
MMWEITLGEGLKARCQQLGNRWNSPKSVLTNVDPLAYGPALDRSPSHPSGEIGMVGSVAAVAESDEVRDLVGAAHRSRKEMMHVGIARLHLRRARNAFVFIPRQNKATGVFPVSHGTPLFIGYLSNSLEESR